MKNLKNHESGISRRKFLGGTAAAAALAMVPVNFGCKPGTNTTAAAQTEPGDKLSSIFGGVQIGTITYSWRSMPGGIENIIKYCKESGINSIELMSNDLEDYLGAPKNPMMAMFGPPPAGQRPAGAPAAGAPPMGTPQPAAPKQAPVKPGNSPAGGFQMPKYTPEQEAAITKYNKDIRDWRIALPLEKIESARKLFADAGIDVHIVKFAPARWSDEEIDFAFKAAKAMGAKGVTEELAEEAVKKLAPFAEKHGMYAIFHNHMQFAIPGFSYNPFMAVSPAVMFNFDAGHFFGSTGIHLNTIIEKYHDRIFSLHLKDKTGPNTDPANTNQVWGQGEMPIADLLLLIKKQKYPIYCDIELEYDVKPWSDAVKQT